MNIDNVDEIVRLRDLRHKAATVVTLMRRGEFLGLTVMDSNGGVFETTNLLSQNLLRGAVAQVAQEEIRVTNERLAQLGVSIPKHERDEPEPQTVEALNKDLGETRRELDMYRNAWLRSLGGKVKPKAHLIDALVITTEEMKSRADRYIEGDVVSKADHDRRVTELLTFNNTLEQRMREARRELHRFLSGTPAERLAFAVEKAAAQTIAELKQEGTLCDAR